MTARVRSYVKAHRTTHTPRLLVRKLGIDTDCLMKRPTISYRRIAVDNRRAFRFLTEEWTGSALPVACEWMAWQCAASGILADDLMMRH